MVAFDKLGFAWDRAAVPASSPVSEQRALSLFTADIVRFVFDACALEGNPHSYEEVETLLGGETVGGRRVSDQQQVLNLHSATKLLAVLVGTRRFALDKSVFTRLHAMVAREEALEWGHFRGEGEETGFTPPVSLGALGRHEPPPTEPGAANLNRMFAEGVERLESDLADPRERAMAFFLFGALRQFCFDGNKRTSRLMMNGMLMSSGLDAISVPAARGDEFNEKMARFYSAKDATETMLFLIDCGRTSPGEGRAIERAGAARRSEGMLAESTRVDLGDFPVTGQVHNLVGHELGEQARDHLGIADLERSYEMIEVSVPEHVYFVSPAFFRGMFLESMKRIRTGSGFFDKFGFDCSWNIREQIVLAAQDFYEDLDDDQEIRKVG